MKTKTSRRAIWYKSLLVLPLLGVLIYSCSTNEIVEENPSDFSGKTLTIPGNEREEGKTQRVETITVSENINIRLLKNGGLVVNDQETTIQKLPEKLSHINAGLPKETRKEMTTADIFIEPEVEMGRLTDVKSALRDHGVSEINVLTVQEDQEQKATSEMIKEYNRLVVYYNAIPREEIIFKQEDINRIMYIRSLMTPEQEEKAEKINFNVPPPPPPAPAPDAVNAPPPPPPSPVEAIKAWGAEGAEFYFGGKNISFQDALDLVKSGKKLRLETEESGTKKRILLSLD